MTEISSHLRIPFFGNIPLPQGLGDITQTSIEDDRDTRNHIIDTVDEAWNAHVLAKDCTAPVVPALLSADCPALIQLSRQMTQVDLRSTTIRVYGHPFKVMVTPEQLRRMATILAVLGEDLHKSPMRREHDLFEIGEALRSFGRPMVARWAFGGHGESALKLALSQRIPSYWIDNMGEPKSYVQWLWEAGFYPEDPRQWPLFYQKTFAEHAEWHLHAADSVFGDYPVVGGVMEGFAELFEGPDHWRLESPALLASIRCFLNSRAAEICRIRP